MTTTKTTAEKIADQSNDIRDAVSKKLAINGVNEWFDQALYILKGQVTEMENYKQRFAEAVATETQFGSPTAVLSWAVNSTMHIHSNLRIDMAISHATRLRDAGIK